MKYVYLFDEGNKDLRDTLGGKGANLAEMTNLGLPVPYGLTVTTNACIKYLEENKLTKEIENQILDGIKQIENKTGKTLGKDLLLSVRSGSPISMPGMMDTVLNLGLNDEIVEKLATDNDTTRFIYDSYRRLIMMFADVVKGKGKDKFEDFLTNYKNRRNYKNDLDLTSDDLINITDHFKRIYYMLTEEDFPQNPKKQLLEAVKAVFRSWNNERAQVYREMNNIPDNLGTAVNIQEMVYGNLSENSLTGVLFSRNPANGENKLYGEYLYKAQGEDIVAGVRTPLNIENLKNEKPNIYEDLIKYSKLLEKHYKDMQDMEFTVENDKLYMLQTRNGKRTPLAALNVAIDMVKEKLITKKEAIKRIDTKDIDKLLHKSFDNIENISPITKGLPASPGAVIGQIVFTKEDVIKKHELNIPTILVREETSPEDIEGLKYAEGIMTIRGGMTSHAAVVARGIGKCCISGVENAYVSGKTLTINDRKYKEGMYLSLDGTTGYVYDKALPLKEAGLSDNFETLLKWAKEYKQLGVKANADTVEDALVALRFGAEGIGLCRSEHMFFEKKKIFAMRRMILANKSERENALKPLLKMQKEDFINLLVALDGKVLTIRYLDPPLHEFLPKTKPEVYELARSLSVSERELQDKIDSMKEFNPMMGLRGCRLSIVYPEIAKMQTKAIFEAIKQVKEMGIKSNVEIMLPLIGDINEFKYLKNIVSEVAQNYDVKYKLGTMLEVPRGVINADVLAKEADFFSYGTNDLTQMTFGFSRDDAGSFINDYYEKGILKSDPFKTIDQGGVGKLILVGNRLAKKTNPKIELGICGEHGGDEESIKYFNKIGINYVSCSPYRVPLAIISSAKAVIENEN